MDDNTISAADTTAAPAVPAPDAPAGAAPVPAPVRQFSSDEPPAPEPAPEPAPVPAPAPEPGTLDPDLAAELLALDAKLREVGSSIPLLLIELARHNLGGSFVRGLHLDSETETTGE